MANTAPNGNVIHARGLRPELEIDRPPRSARPLLLIDVDGVLNPFAAGACPEGYREYGFFPGEEPVRLCCAHGEWLRGLAQRFDLVWATGWGESANRLIAPVLGLAPLPTIVFPPVPFDPSEKLPAVRAFVGDRPCVWIDDVVTPAMRAWARQRATLTLLIATDPAVGLTSAAVERITAWHPTDP